MNWTRIRKQLGNRSAIIGAGVAGFLVGAGGFVAAQIDDSPSAEIETENTIDDSPSTTDDTMPDTTVADSMPDDSVAPTSVDLTVPDTTVDDSSSSSVPSNTIDDSSSSSVPSNTIDDSPSSSVPSNTIDDSSSSSVPSNTIDDHGGDRDDDDSDDSSSSSVPSNTIDDSPNNSVPVSLPAAFSRSYQSAGGSIDVTWTGTAFVLNAVSPAPGFGAEIEDQSWDRIRVDFEGEDDARIEVRLNDGQIRVRID